MSRSREIALLIDSAVSALVRREVEVIEQACEASLTDPAGRGVRVDRYVDHVDVYLSDDVPFGSIHEHTYRGWTFVEFSDTPRV